MGEKQAHIQLDDSLGIEKAVIVGDPARVDKFKTFLEDAQDLTYNREFKSLRGKYNGEDILILSTGVGAPSACIAVEELNNIGVKDVVRVGSAGAMQPGIDIGELIIADGAVRDEGLTKKYVPIEFPAVPNVDLLVRAKKLAPQAHFGKIRSHDGFYMDDNAKTEAFWSGFGIIGADMESTALMIVGELRGLRTLSILNNVVLYEADLQEGVNDLVNEAEKAAQGELDSIRLALDVLTSKEA